MMRLSLKPLHDLPPQTIGELPLVRSIKQAEVCPRKASAKEHQLGHLYHVRNRSSLACISDIVLRRDLHKLIGKWESA